MVKIQRRQFAGVCAVTLAIQQALAAGQTDVPSKDGRFQLNYLLGSCMYGCADLDEILPEVAKTGAAAIDIWPKNHGNQREQLTAMGEAAFAKKLADHGVQLGCITQYRLGPFGLRDEMKLAKRLGCRTIVTGSSGPKGLQGSDLKSAVKRFTEQMKPHLAIAEKNGVTIAIENHGNSLIQSPDALKWLVEFAMNKHLAVAIAPYHLKQDPECLATLIRTLDERIAILYAWQHGLGCMQKRPKQQELLQMPGRGGLNFGPLVDALKDIRYRGWTEIFMHPVPRGIPILDTTSAVTAEINRSRAYLDALL